MEKTKLFQAPTEPEVPLVSKRGGRVIHISFDGQIVQCAHQRLSLRCGSSKAHEHGILLLFKPGFETKLLFKRIDGAIQVRSNVDPTFYSLVGSGWSGRDNHGSSLLDSPYE
ncbi:hypothetical protein CXB51_003213 [Gossypium anomalum]|uniref:Uncharacterized protein ycf68 n=1 Tax=Gossypium anomalum TaxID=47600 RepID=A0A8J5ZG55_9ROSI|nr:hypothetical protein CXB51_003213 [Gossypium anomalum]